MNAYYQNESIRQTTRYTTEIHTSDRLIAFICTIVAIFTSRAAIIITKCALCTAGILMFFGIIGSMESGRIGMLFGAVLCLAIIAIESTLIRSAVRTSKAKR